MQNSKDFSNGWQRLDAKLAYLPFLLFLTAGGATVNKLKRSLSMRTYQKCRHSKHTRTNIVVDFSHRANHIGLPVD
jgi:hypothetical protein